MPVTHQTGRVMKKPEEYSKNPNTIRARARKARLDPYTREVEQARASDSKAVTRAWNIHTRTEAYRDATQTVRKTMLQQVEKEVMERRKSKGYDASSKIERFIRLNNKSPPGPPSINGTPATRMTGYDSSVVVPAPPDFMQPMAPMHPTPITDHSGSNFATPGPYYNQVMPSVEDQRALTEVSFSQQHLRMRTPQPISHSLEGSYLSLRDQPNETDTLYEDTTKAYLQIKINKQEAEIEELGRAIQGLIDDLALAKSTIRLQDARINQLEEGVQLYCNTTPSQIGPKVQLGWQASRLQNIVLGIQRITGVVTDVCNSITIGGIDNTGASNLSNSHVTNLRDGTASDRNGHNVVSNVKENGKQTATDDKDAVNRCTTSSGASNC